MVKIFMWIVSLLEQIKRDRLYHYIAGMIVGSFCILALLLGWWAILVVAVVAVMKEAFDILRGSRADMVDILYTIAGGMSIQAMYAIPYII